jgi:hypothetical protein
MWLEEKNFPQNNNNASESRERFLVFAGVKIFNLCEEILAAGSLIKASERRRL